METRQSSASYIYNPVLYTQLRPSKNVLREKKWVCMNEKESQMEKSEKQLIFPLSVAKETNQRCPHSRLQVTGDIEEMAARGQRNCWRERLDFKLKWYNRVWQRERREPEWS